MRCGDGTRNRGASGGAGSLPTQRVDLDRYAMSETAMGGADAVQKTSYGVGHGTEPDGREEYAPVGRLKGEGPVVGETGSGGGTSVVTWVVCAVAGLVALLYGFGVLAR